MAALDLPMAQQDEGTQQPQQAAAPAPAPAPQQAVPTTVVNPALGPDDTGGPPTPKQYQQPTTPVKPVAQSEPTPNAQSGEKAGEKAGDTTKAVQTDQTDQSQTNTPAISGAPGATQERPVLDPRPLQWLKQNEPEKYNLVNQVAQERGVSPQRLAFHWMTEGGFQENVPRGKAGEWGPVQVMPDTGKNFNDGGKLDITNPIDNLRIGANYMRSLDQKFGKDSPSSIGAYQGGEGSMADMAKNPGMALKNHPNTVAYMQRAFPGFNIGPQSVTGESKMTFNGAVQAGSQGPQGFLQYITDNAPEGMTLTDSWRHVEGLLVASQLAKGDIAGAQHARDFVMQMAYTGANQNLMQAYQHLNAGDATGAAQFLARSHAFFPDGTMGKYGVDQQGQLWAQRIDEHNPNRVLSSFKVDANGIAGMLNQTMDPQKFLGTLLEQQKVAISARHQDLLGQHFNDMAENNMLRAQNSEDRANTAEQRANETERHNRETEKLTEQLRETQAARSGENKQLHSAADREVSDLYGPDTDKSEDPATRSAKAQLYKAARVDGGADPVTAEHVAGGLSDHTLKLLKGKSGDYAVVDGQGKAVGYLPKAAGDRFAGSQAPQVQPGARPGQPSSAVNTTPVGAGASTPMAAATGMTNNLSGTVSSAQSSGTP